MTDKQQIEEMAKEMCVLTYTCANCDNYNYCPHIGEATILYNANYRQIPENAVVLTREEFDRLNSCIKSEEEVRAIMQQQMLPIVRELTDKEVGTKLGTVAALVRKATANEFYDKINENICSFKLENKSQEFIDGYAQAIADICGRLDQVAKQFGVEDTK